MHAVEKFVFALRHDPRVEKAEWLWRRIRPVYDWMSSIAAPRGITRVINGTDRLLLSPKWRMIGERYEPEVWRALMNEVRVGDVIADVGSYVGLYTIALAQRIGASGTVVAFEPDDSNSRELKQHVELNSVADRVRIVRAAVGEREGFAEFASNLDSSFISGAIAASTKNKSVETQCVTLDGFFAGKKLDLLKIDVEGYEQKVLEGATELLTDERRSPRTIFIEVHPYAWSALGTTSDSILQLLKRFNYEVKEIGGQTVERISEYGEIVAYKIA
jgi:FkbM family methyltransferase